MSSEVGTLNLSVPFVGNASLTGQSLQVPEGWGRAGSRRSQVGEAAGSPASRLLRIGYETGGL